MQLNPYLNFDGQCEAAFRRYAEVLGGTITDLNTFRGTPAGEHVPEDMQDKVLHASMKIGAGVLMGSDSPRDITSRRRARTSRCTSRTRPREIASSTRSRRAARSGCRSRRRSGRRGSACWWTGTVRPG